ncbi:MAG: acyl-CoA thioesterase [Clostridiaceae bacterium]|nr:acyl-CoA thioesterase [Clostridiaceae bacterium]
MKQSDFSSDRPGSVPESEAGTIRASGSNASPGEQMKRCSDSHTEHVQIVMYRHTNGSGRLFGGALLQMIDVVGAICARRHSGTEVTTVAIDHLSFRAPAQINSTLLLVAEIESVGNTSMRVKVCTYVERLNGEKEEINTAYVTYVSLDENNLPRTVPRLCTDS